MMEKPFEFRDALRQRNAEFQKLEETHHRLERELNELIRRKTLTPEEESHKKQIQVEKLHTKDRLEAILREYTKQHSPHS
ncbi:MAG TPA: DUF465 domain-containing protein [Nitrospiria bacterium]|nr:DUF465 domain-containing protein [Nitrospiria bacterium]